jgi:hypothetical protein
MVLATALGVVIPLIMLLCVIAGYALGQSMFAQRKFILSRRHRLYSGRTLQEIEEDLARHQFTRNRLNEAWHEKLLSGDSTVGVDNALGALKYRYEKLCKEHEECLWNLRYSTNEENCKPPSTTPYR